MPTNRNPSFSLSDRQVDDIVDRLLLGKYEKHRPVQAIEPVRAGLLNRSDCHDYVVARWGHRPSWSRNPDAGLSTAGITMRTNKLWERAQTHVNAVSYGNVQSDDLVWKIVDNLNYSTVCFATGSREGARNWAFTLFGWTLREGIRLDDMRAILAGAGGAQAASMMNITRLGELGAQIKDLEEKSHLYARRAEALRLVHDTVASAASYSTDGTGATAG